MMRFEEEQFDQGLSYFEDDETNSRSQGVRKMLVGLGIFVVGAAASLGAFALGFKLEILGFPLVIGFLGFAMGLQQSVTGKAWGQLALRNRIGILLLVGLVMPIALFILIVYLLTVVFAKVP